MSNSSALSAPCIRIRYLIESYEEHRETYLFILYRRQLLEVFRYSMSVLYYGQKRRRGGGTIFKLARKVGDDSSFQN